MQSCNVDEWISRRFSYWQGCKQLYRYIARPTNKWSGNSASGNTRTGLLLLIYVGPRATHFGGYCCWFVGPRATQLTGYCRFMWHLGQHTLLGIVVGLCGGFGQHTLVGIVVGLMWGRGQDTLLGIVVGFCGASGYTLHWVLLAYLSPGATHFTGYCCWFIWGSWATHFTGYCCWLMGFPIDGHIC
jgi:hypothetical protein